MMGNMSYCRFENTFHDLEDCYEHMEKKELSKSETRYRRRLIELCEKIMANYGDELDEDED